MHRRETQKQDPTAKLGNRNFCVPWNQHNFVQLRLKGGFLAFFLWLFFFKKKYQTVNTCFIQV